MAKKRKRKGLVSKQKDVFFYTPDMDRHNFYIQLTLTKSPTQKLLTDHQIGMHFSKYGVARFCNKTGTFLEIWMRTGRVRIGTPEVAERFVSDYYANENLPVPSDMTTGRIVLGLATDAFAKAYKVKIGHADIDMIYPQQPMLMTTQGV